MKDVCVIMSFTGLLLFIFSLLFMSIFKTWETNEFGDMYMDKHWSSLDVAMKTVFIIMTEGWVDIHDGQPPVEIPLLASILVYFVFMVLGIGMMGLVDAVFVDALSSARSENERVEEEKVEEVCDVCSDHRMAQVRCCHCAVVNTELSYRQGKSCISFLPNYLRQLTLIIMAWTHHNLGR